MQCVQLLNTKSELAVAAAAANADGVDREKTSRGGGDGGGGGGGGGGSGGGGSGGGIGASGEELQRLGAEELPLPITAIVYDEAENVLVSGYQHLQAWPSRLHAAENVQVQQESHSAAVCAALYNPTFHVVISADTESNIIVWNIETGQLSGRFTEAHARPSPSPSPSPNPNPPIPTLTLTLTRFTEAHGTEAITTLAFDRSNRRLISGAHDGSLKLWNFSTGELRALQALYTRPTHAIHTPYTRPTRALHTPSHALTRPHTPPHARIRPTNALTRPCTPPHALTRPCAPLHALTIPHLHALARPDSPLPRPPRRLPQAVPQPRYLPPDPMPRYLPPQASASSSASTRRPRSLPPPATSATAPRRARCWQP